MTSKVPSYDYYWPNTNTAAVTDLTKNKKGVTLQDIRSRVGAGSLEKLNVADSARIARLISMVPDSPILVVANNIVQNVISVRTFVEVALSPNEQPVGC